MAPNLHDSALMKGQRAEGAGPEAAPVTYKAEFDLLDGGHAAQFCVAGVPGALVGQIVDGVHLLHGQGLLRRVLHHEFLAVGFRQTLGGEGVTVAILDFEGLGVFFLIGFQFLKRRKNDGGQALVQLAGPKHGAVDVGDVPDVHTGVQSLGNLHDALFPHAVHEKVGLTVKQNGALHALRPIIIVSKPPQAGFNAAD